MALLAAAVSGGADTSVVRDLGDLYKIQREGRPESISLEEYWARREKIKARVTPIVQGELAKLKDGELPRWRVNCLTTRRASIFALESSDRNSKPIRMTLKPMCWKKHLPPCRIHYGDVLF